MYTISISVSKLLNLKQQQQQPKPTKQTNLKTCTMTIGAVTLALLSFDANAILPSCSSCFALKICALLLSSLLLVFKRLLLSFRRNFQGSTFAIPLIFCQIPIRKSPGIVDSIIFPTILCWCLSPVLEAPSL